MSNFLFVYGTLKSETKILDSLIGANNYQVAGSGNIQGEWLIGTPYPAVVQGREKEIIRGELIEILNFPKSIEVIDAYEEFIVKDIQNSLYIRALTLVVMDNKDRIEAWVYYYNK